MLTENAYNHCVSNLRLFLKKEAKLQLAHPSILSAVTYKKGNAALIVVNQ